MPPRQIYISAADRRHRRRHRHRRRDRLTTLALPLACILLAAAATIVERIAG